MNDQHHDHGGEHQHDAGQAACSGCPEGTEGTEAPRDRIAGLMRVAVGVKPLIVAGLVIGWAAGTDPETISAAFL
ncbi:hypothetical protein RMN57_00305 [Kitasatospora sp. CM 4170]|uniref:Cation transporter n=1 Tax=Kitasatospora aburaviensis TaxID=67265 RepID=A0ABW1F481_9ACTN|nr:hypothetical protein [Kitasatospora sp. CM 4170]WNM43251.1 hypothetical protein RMN57_00305 [Kitasatospora sp. CM 4170]